MGCLFFVCTGPFGFPIQNLNLSIRDVVDVPKIIDRPSPFILALVVTAVWQRHSSIMTDYFVMAAC